MRDLTLFRLAILCTASGLLLSLQSCGSAKPFLDASVPQEQALTPVKITDETQNSVVGNTVISRPYSWKTSGYGGGKNVTWDTGRRLSASPDGNSLAYISIVDKAPNVMVRKSNSGGSSTQRTFRRASNVFWGTDNRLYFNDNTSNTSTIGSVDSQKGSLIKQLTSNNNDWSPAVTPDGNTLYFTRFDSSGPSIWSLNLVSGELTNCTRGYGPSINTKNPNQILLTRNSEKGNSEIWMVDIEKGDEILLLSDSEKGFSDPVMSPDGEWILVVGNALSSVSKKQNLDLYAIKSDGSQLTQLTYHPAQDVCPTWSQDGKYIYFISSRANKNNSFNIWRINNPLH